MKIGVSTYSYHPMLQSGQWTLAQVIDEAARVGYEAIEYSPVGLGDDAVALELAPSLRRACADAKLTATNYCVSADFLQNDAKAEVERVKRHVRVAAELGVPVMRFDATVGFPQGTPTPRGFSAALPILADACRALAAYAQTLGVATTIENHGYFCQDPERVEALMNAVGHPNFGLLLDVGNFWCADADTCYAVGLLASHAKHVHLKDFHRKPADTPLHPGQGWFSTRGGSLLRGAIVGHGDVPLLGALRVLRAAGYAGNIGIEFEGIEDPILGSKLGLENARRLVAMAGFDA